MKVYAAVATVLLHHLSVFLLWLLFVCFRTVTLFVCFHTATSLVYSRTVKSNSGDDQLFRWKPLLINTARMTRFIDNISIACKRTSWIEHKSHRWTRFVSSTRWLAAKMPWWTERSTLSANRLLLISAPSMRVWRSELDVSAPRSLPENSHYHRHNHCHNVCLYFLPRHCIQCFYNICIYNCNL